jgi:hypothetical protein
MKRSAIAIVLALAVSPCLAQNNTASGNAAQAPAPAQVASPASLPGFVGLKSFNAEPAGGQLDEITNRWLNWAHEPAAEGAIRPHEFIWVDSQTPANAKSLLSAYIFDSAHRILDFRGTNCMDDHGTFTVTDNALCIEAVETEHDPVWKDHWAYRAAVHIGYDSMKGGVYDYTGLKGGKSTRVPLLITNETHTAAQNFGEYFTQTGYAGGELIGIGITQKDIGGFIGNGQESNEGVRIDQSQGPWNDGFGGTWSAKNAEVNTADGMVKFTPDKFPFTLGETRFIRDLNSAYSKGSYTNVNCAGMRPSTCRITGEGTEWTSIPGFVGVHTKFDDLEHTGPILSSNLVFCAVPAASNKQNNGYPKGGSGFDFCVPVTEGVDANTLTVNLYFRSTANNTTWTWPTSGEYVIYRGAYPTEVDIEHNTFKAGDVSGIGQGHLLDQVMAYNSDFAGILVLQRRTIGRPNFGSGVDIYNASPPDAPIMGQGLSITGGYQSAICIGCINSETKPVYNVKTGTPGSIEWLDWSLGDSEQVFLGYRSSPGKIESAITYNRGPASANPGLGFYGKSRITPSGEGEFAHLDQAEGRDIGGTIEIRGGTSGSVRFSMPYAKAPVCTLTPTSNPSSIGAYWVSTSATEIHANVSNSGSIVFSYTCVGSPN